MLQKWIAIYSAWYQNLWIIKNIRLSYEIGLDEGVHCNSDEHQADKAYYDDTDDLHSLEPGLSVPAYSLEHAPEAVGKVEPDGCEP